MRPFLCSNEGDGLKNDFNKYFAIDKIYAEHTEEVRGLLWRQKIYSKADRDVKKEQIGEAICDGFDFDRFILGTFTGEDEGFKRPLTIMKQDIIKQLEENKDK